MCKLTLQINGKSNCAKAESSFDSVKKKEKNKSHFARFELDRRCGEGSGKLCSVDVVFLFMLQGTKQHKLYVCYLY